MGLNDRLNRLEGRMGASTPRMTASELDEAMRGYERAYADCVDHKDMPAPAAWRASIETCQPQMQRFWASFAPADFAL